MKVALLGIDAALPTIIKDLVSKGIIPNIKYLIDNGVWAEGLPVFPTVTSTNWTTISTGAMPSKHGITDMVIHEHGKDLTEITSAFYSYLCKAEHIWDTCERFDKIPILLKYIASWPPTIKKGIQIEGFGAPGGPGSRPWGSSPLAIANASCYSTVPLENSKSLNFKLAERERWAHIYDISDNVYEANIEIGNNEKKSRYYILVQKDFIIFTKEHGQKYIKLYKNESRWVIDDDLNAAFRIKLMNINCNSSIDLKLYISQIFPLDGWSYPSYIAKELYDNIGPFIESISHFPFVFNWIDADTYLEEVRYQALWFVNATKYLTKYKWDLFMMQWHGIDNTQHAFLRFDKNILNEEEKRLSEYVVNETYKIADNMIGGIINNLDHDTTIFVLSDHGHIIGKRRFFINSYLYKKGYITLKVSDSKKLTIDWSKTLAYAPAMVHIYLNVKGRDPHGIVNKGKEYEDLQQEIIDILCDIKDPITKIRPIAFALANNDAAVLGIDGDRSGDIIYIANPGFAIDNRITQGELFEDLKVGLKGGSIHGQQLGSIDLKENGTIRSMFIAYGPNIKKGYTLDKPIRFIDIAPTISYLLNIPPPRDSEGRVIYELFE